MSDTFGTVIPGKEEDNCPKTLPIVCTSNFAKYTMRVVTTMATSEPGILSVILGHTSIIAIAIRPISVAVQLMVPIFWM